MIVYSSLHSKRKKNSDVEGVVVDVHDTTIVGPIVSTSLALARFTAAERAHAILRDIESEKYLQRLCTCSMQVDDQTESTVVPSDLEKEVVKVLF